jgi:hypothetical protein
MDTPIISKATQVAYTGISVFSLSESYLYPNQMRDQAALKQPEGTWVVSVFKSILGPQKKNRNHSATWISVFLFRLV